MARPIVADVDLAAIAANLASVRRFAPGVRSARRRQGQRVRPRPAARAARARRRRRTCADRARRGARAARGRLFAPDPAARRILRSAPSSNRFAHARLAHRRARRRAGADARDGASSRAHRRVRQGQHRDESPWVRARRRCRRVCARLEALQAVCEHAADDAFRARRRRRRHRRAARAIRARSARALPYPRSLANSAGVVRYGEIGGDGVRPGIMLYGATPFATRSAEALGLVAGDDAALAADRACRRLRAAIRVGYGASFRAPRAMRIGVVACGYADGYPRHAPNGTPVLVMGSACRWRAACRWT